MAAKHDGKHARANIWVMQQNLAKQKGGRPGYQFKERVLPKAAKASAASAASVSPVPSDAPALASTASPESPASDAPV